MWTECGPANLLYLFGGNNNKTLHVFADILWLNIFIQKLKILKRSIANHRGLSNILNKMYYTFNGIGPKVLQIQYSHFHVNLHTRQCGRINWLVIEYGYGYFVVQRNIARESHVERFDPKILWWKKVFMNENNYWINKQTNQTSNRSYHRCSRKKRFSKWFWLSIQLSHTYTSDNTT